MSYAMNRSRSMIQPWWGEAGGSRRRDGRDIKRPEVNVIDTGMVQKKKHQDGGECQTRFCSINRRFELGGRTMNFHVHAGIEASARYGFVWLCVLAAGGV